MAAAELPELLRAMVISVLSAFPAKAAFLRLFLGSVKSSTWDPGQCHPPPGQSHEAHSDHPIPEHTGHRR